MGIGYISFKDFNQKFKTNIQENPSECILSNYNLADEGLKYFCQLKLNSLELLYLNNNNITNINYFKDFRGPCLKRLDLSHNKIKEIDVFANFKSPLENLDLSFNIINNIDIFKNDNTLPKLNKLFIGNNDINFKDKEISDIMSKLKKRMSNKYKSSIESSASSNHSSTSQLLKLPTMNYKFENYFINSKK